MRCVGSFLSDENLLASLCVAGIVSRNASSSVRSIRFCVSRVEACSHVGEISHRVRMLWVSYVARYSCSSKCARAHGYRNALASYGYRMHALLTVSKLTTDFLRIRRLTIKSSDHSAPHSVTPPTLESGSSPARPSSAYCSASSSPKPASSRSQAVVAAKLSPSSPQMQRAVDLHTRQNAPKP